MTVREERASYEGSGRKTENKKSYSFKKHHEVCTFERSCCIFRVCHPEVSGTEMQKHACPREGGEREKTFCYQPLAFLSHTTHEIMKPRHVTNRVLIAGASNCQETGLVVGAMKRQQAPLLQLTVGEDLSHFPCPQSSARRSWASAPARRTLFDFQEKQMARARSSRDLIRSRRGCLGVAMVLPVPFHLLHNKCKMSLRKEMFTESRQHLELKELGGLNCVIST